MSKIGSGRAALCTLHMLEETMSRLPQQSHTGTHTQTHKDRQTQTQTHTYTQRQRQTHIETCTQTQTHRDVHKQTHTHSLSPLSLSLSHLVRLREEHVVEVVLPALEALLDLLHRAYRVGGAPGQVRVQDHVVEGEAGLLPERERERE